jgi:hypothetical protein
VQPHFNLRGADSSSSAPSLPPELKTAEFVYVKAPPSAPSLSPSFRGLYAVHKRTAKFFIIKIGGRYDAVSIDRLKPHLGGPVAPASPPKSGGGLAALPGSCLLFSIPGHRWGGAM